jgi:hypothetical protein
MPNDLWCDAARIELHSSKASKTSRDFVSEFPGQNNSDRRTIALICGDNQNYNR